MYKLMHKNSLEAFNSLNKKERCHVIIRTLEVFGQLTDREIAYKLGFKERNATAPRITEMIYNKDTNPDGVLKECGKTKDSVTHRTVRVVRLLRSEDKMQYEFDERGRGVLV